MLRPSMIATPMSYSNYPVFDKILLLQILLWILQYTYIYCCGNHFKSLILGKRSAIYLCIRAFQLSHFMISENLRGPSIIYLLFKLAFISLLKQLIDIFHLQDTGIISNSKLEEVTCSTSTSSDRSETVPLLNREVIMNVNHVKEWPRKSCGGIVSRTIFSSRPSIFLISIATVCLGICAVLLHPHKVSEFAVSIRRCLFDRIQQWIEPKREVFSFICNCKYLLYTNTRLRKSCLKLWFVTVLNSLHWKLDIGVC